MNLVQQLTEELTATTKWGQELEARINKIEAREQALRQIVDAVFLIASPGAEKNVLWARYQGLENKESE